MRYDTDGATFLKVPFAEKEEAKALGARWDALTKHWYVPAGMSTLPFTRWKPRQAERGIEAPAQGSDSTRSGSQA